MHIYLSLVLILFSFYNRLGITLGWWLGVSSVVGVFVFGELSL